MTRTEQNTMECWDEENKEFDWDEYQHLCDCADYWDCEEQPKRSEMAVSRELTAPALMMAGQRKPKKAGKTG